MVIQSLNEDALRAEFNQARPFRHFFIENFLEEDFAAEVAASYPSFEGSLEVGRGFNFVNEKLKVQVTEYDKFPAATQRLADALAAPEFLAAISRITGISDLMWDDRFAGGGMHQTASSGRLDVHVDFNLLRPHNMYRRLNLLLYLNPVWESSWGGEVELWDRQVKVCHRSILPKINRCLVFETSEISFHGVTAVTCPPHVRRQSFAVYFYTREAPDTYAGHAHSTVFKARPDEHLKRYVLMPAERIQRSVAGRVQEAKRNLKNLVRRPHA